MSQTTTRIRVFAKINLFLRILGKRADGYHEVETVMHPVGLADELEATKQENGFTLECESKDVPAGPHNTIFRTYHRLRERFPDKVGGCRIRLNKAIPTQAGMGGASADAAGTLLALDHLFDLKMTGEERLEHASAIGSDVAFFLGQGPALATGRGEKIRPLEGHLSAPVVLAVSPDGVSTPEAYRRFEADASEAGMNVRTMEEAIRKGDATEAANRLYNTFERLIYPVRPDLQKIRMSLLASGADGALMTGSGATIFALGLRNAGFERAQAVIDQMERTLICSTLQRTTHEWLNERDADLRSDPS